MKIVAYYAGWATRSGREVRDINASLLTHLNYAFANVSPDLRAVVGDPKIDLDKRFPDDTDDEPFYGNYNQLRKLKEKHPHVKVIIAIGGWTWSGRFSDAALTPESRQRFAQSAVDLVERYGFDGIDIDWEYPVAGGLPENKRRPEDKQNFTLLMASLREHLDQLSKKTGKDYTLTFAAGAGPYFVKNVELKALADIVDFVNLMTYDMNGPWSSRTGFTAPLRRGPQLKQDWSVEDAVDLFLHGGIPKEKLVVGVPFYGHEYEGASPDQHGLFQPFKQARSLPYRHIKELPWAQGDRRLRHAIAATPYAYDRESFISFEDPESIAAKAKYIRSRGLAGAMIWEISQDTNDHELLTELHRHVTGKV